MCTELPACRRLQYMFRLKVKLKKMPRISECLSIYSAVKAKAVKEK